MHHLVSHVLGSLRKKLQGLYRFQGNAHDRALMRGFISKAYGLVLEEQEHLCIVIPTTICSAR